MSFTIEKICIQNNCFNISIKPEPSCFFYCESCAQSLVVINQDFSLNKLVCGPPTSPYHSTGPSPLSRDPEAMPSVTLILTS